MTDGSDKGVLDSALEGGGKVIRLAAMASALYLVQPGDASAETAADRHLRELGKLPASCAQLVGSDSGSVDSCRAAFKTRLGELQVFVSSKEARGLTVLDSKTKEKDRCTQALPILTSKKNEMLEIARFLGAEIKDDASDPVSRIIAKKTLEGLRASLRRAPTADEFVAHSDASIESARQQVASCGLIVRGAMGLAMMEGGKVQTAIETQLPELFRLIDEGITQTSDVPRLKRAVVAMVSLLALLEAAAEAGAR